MALLIAIGIVVVSLMAGAAGLSYRDHQLSTAWLNANSDGGPGGGAGGPAGGGGRRGRGHGTPRAGEAAVPLMWSGECSHTVLTHQRKPRVGLAKLPKRTRETPYIPGLLQIYSTLLGVKPPSPPPCACPAAAPTDNGAAVHHFYEDDWEEEQAQGATPGPGGQPQRQHGIAGSGASDGGRVPRGQPVVVLAWRDIHFRVQKASGGKLHILRGISGVAGPVQVRLSCPVGPSQGMLANRLLRLMMQVISVSSLSRNQLHTTAAVRCLCAARMPTCHRPSTRPSALNKPPRCARRSCWPPQARHVAGQLAPPGPREPCAGA